MAWYLWFKIDTKKKHIANGYLRIKTASGYGCNFSVTPLFYNQFADTCISDYYNLFLVRKSLEAPWCVTSTFTHVYTHWGWCKGW